MLHRIYWICWIGGVGAIILGRLGFVSSDVGWAGFYVACAAAVISRLPQRAAPEQVHEFAILSRGMLESKDRGYALAMETLRRGGTVVYDGLMFADRPGNELALALVASLPAGELDETDALQDAKRAQATFAELARLSPEVAALASEKRPRMTLLSEYGPNGVEICEIRDGQIEWKVSHGSSTAGSGERNLAE